MIIPGDPTANSQVLNRYTYALNNPLRFTDPSGNESEDTIDDQEQLREEAHDAVSSVLGSGNTGSATEPVMVSNGGSGIGSSDQLDGSAGYVSGGNGTISSWKPSWREKADMFLDDLGINWGATKYYYGNASGELHGTLDATGMVFDPADLINGGLYLLEGDLKNAGYSAGSLLFVGDACLKGAKYVDNIKVIGRLEDTAIAKGWKGHDVLDIPNWSLGKNKAWVQEGINNGQNFYIASPTKGNLIQKSGTYKGGPTVFAQELKQLEKAGYKRSGDYMVPPKN